MISSVPEALRYSMMLTAKDAVGNRHITVGRALILGSNYTGKQMVQFTLTPFSILRTHSPPLFCSEGTQKSICLFASMLPEHTSS